MRLSLGISSCPNDTFIFDALIHGKVDTEGLAFDVCMTDVEDLNRKAFNRSIQVTKLSFHAFAYAAENYTLLNSGSALGRKNGPLLISKSARNTEDIHLLRIAIPGKYTTANLLFSIFFPEAWNKQEYIFSDIEGVLLNNDADAGVIIHENRFTFEKRGLVKLADLGDLWESKTGFPIPLGGIAVDNSLPLAIQQKVDRVVKRSVRYAIEFPESSAGFVKKNAQELEMEIIKRHIDLYVNDFTVDLAETGKDAIRVLYQIAGEKRVLPVLSGDYFLNQ
jgi:1,4-dihydroxy-6-naphthoate synthase